MGIPVIVRDTLGRAANNAGELARQLECLKHTLPDIAARLETQSAELEHLEVLWDQLRERVERLEGTS